MRHLGKNDNDSEEGTRPGMEDAFRQLEALQSLSDDAMEIIAPPAAPTQKIESDATLLPENRPTTDVSLEQEISVYRDMVGELEQNEDSAAYSEILNDLGAAPKQVDDTYSQVLLDLGGTPSQLIKKNDDVKTDIIPPSVLSPNDDEGEGNISTEQFMDIALQEALKEVKVNNPKILGTGAQSVLDNEEIMKEIEGIFEQGNEKLLASLEEMRLEQVRSFMIIVFALGFVVDIFGLCSALFEIGLRIAPCIVLFLHQIIVGMHRSVFSKN